MSGIDPKNLSPVPSYQVQSPTEKQDLEQISTWRFGTVLAVVEGRLENVNIFRALLIKIANFAKAMREPTASLNSSVDSEIVEDQVLHLLASKCSSPSFVSEKTEKKHAISLIHRFGNDAQVEKSHPELNHILNRLNTDQPLTLEESQELIKQFEERMQKTIGLAKNTFTFLSQMASPSPIQTGSPRNSFSEQHAKLGEDQKEGQGSETKEQNGGSHKDLEKTAGSQAPLNPSVLDPIPVAPAISKGILEVLPPSTQDLKLSIASGHSSVISQKAPIQSSKAQTLAPRREREGHKATKIKIVGVVAAVVALAGLVFSALAPPGDAAPENHSGVSRATSQGSENSFDWELHLENGKSSTEQPFLRSSESFVSESLVFGDGDAIKTGRPVSPTHEESGTPPPNKEFLTTPILNEGTEPDEDESTHRSNVTSTRLGDIMNPNALSGNSSNGFPSTLSWTATYIGLTPPKDKVPDSEGGAPEVSQTKEPPALPILNQKLTPLQEEAQKVNAEAVSTLDWLGASLVVVVGMVVGSFVFWNKKKPVGATGSSPQITSQEAPPQSFRPSPSDEVTPNVDTQAAEIVGSNEFLSVKWEQLTKLALTAEKMVEYSLNAYTVSSGNEIEKNKQLIQFLISHIFIKYENKVGQQVSRAFFQAIFNDKKLADSFMQVLNGLDEDRSKLPSDSLKRRLADWFMSDECTYDATADLTSLMTRWNSNIQLGPETSALTYIKSVIEKFKKKELPIKNMGRMLASLALGSSSSLCILVDELNKEIGPDLAASLKGSESSAAARAHAYLLGAELKKTELAADFKDRLIFLQENYPIAGAVVIELLMENQQEKKSILDSDIDAFLEKLLNCQQDKSIPDDQFADTKNQVLIQIAKGILKKDCNTPSTLTHLNKICAYLLDQKKGALKIVEAQEILLEALESVKRRFVKNLYAKTNEKDFFTFFQNTCIAFSKACGVADNGKELLKEFALKIDETNNRLKDNEKDLSTYFKEIKELLGGGATEPTTELKSTSASPPLTPVTILRVAEVERKPANPEVPEEKLTLSEKAIKGHEEIKAIIDKIPQDLRLVERLKSDSPLSFQSSTERDRYLKLLDIASERLAYSEDVKDHANAALICRHRMQVLLETGNEVKLYHSASDYIIKINSWKPQEKDSFFFETIFPFFIKKKFSCAHELLRQIFDYPQIFLEAETITAIGDILKGWEALPTNDKTNEREAFINFCHHLIVFAGGKQNLKRAEEIGELNQLEMHVNHVVDLLIAIQTPSEELKKTLPSIIHNLTIKGTAADFKRASKLLKKMEEANIPSSGLATVQIYSSCKNITEACTFTEELMESLSKNNYAFEDFCSSFIGSALKDSEKKTEQLGNILRTMCERLEANNDKLDHLLVGKITQLKSILSGSQSTDSTNPIRLLEK